MKKIARLKNMDIYLFGSLATGHQTLHTTTPPQKYARERIGRCQKNRVHIMFDYPNISFQFSSLLRQFLSDNHILVKAIGKAFASLGLGSSFWHGSETLVGGDADVRVNDLFGWIVYQEGVRNLPTENPSVIYELSLEPR